MIETVLLVILVVVAVGGIALLMGIPTPKGDTGL
jgi:hypothetical protein